MCFKREENIIQTIVHYIFQLKEEKDFEIFALNDLQSVGKFYYKKIKNIMPTVTDDMINNAVLAISNPTTIIESQKNFYTKIVDIIGICKSPTSSFRLSKYEFNKLKNNYDNYLSKVKSKLKQLNSELSTTFAKINKIETKSHRNLTEDISPWIFSLSELYYECRLIETYMEIIQFDEKYVLKKFAEFCNNFSASSDCQKTINELAWKNLFTTETDLYYYENMQHYIDVATSNMNDVFVLPCKIKIQPIYNEIYTANISKYFSKEANGEEYNIDDDYAGIPTINELITSRSNEPEAYIHQLRTLINNYHIINNLRNIIEEAPALSHRKDLLLKAVELFEGNDLKTFLHISVIQIEGIFYDLLLDSNTFNNFNGIDIFTNKVLKEKIQLLFDSPDIDILEYFYIYFNNLIRNSVAHGKNLFSNNHTQLEAMALEILLDMNAILFLFTRKSELYKMHDFIYGVKKSNPILGDIKNARMGALFYTFCEQRIAMLRNNIEKYNPIQVVYWLFNPTYETKYKKSFDIVDLLEIREIACSKEFWEYCNNEIERLLEIDVEYVLKYKSIVTVINLLLSRIEDKDTKGIMIKILKKFPKS